MKFGKKTREFTADTLRKIAEYLLSIVILGSIISGHFYWNLLITSGIIFILLILIAIITMATTEDKEE